MQSENIISAIKHKLSENDEIIAAYLFGSFLHSKEYEDIDIGIILEKSFKPDYLYEINLTKILEEFFKKKFDKYIEFDIHILNNQNLRFLFSILQKAMLIISKNDKKRAKFESQVIIRYLDIKPLYEYYDKMRKLRYANR